MSPHVVPEWRGLPIVGALPALLWDPLRSFTRAAALGDVVRFRIGRDHGTLVSDPTLVREVLSDEARFGRHEGNLDELRRLIGLGILTADDADWRRRRQALVPTFRRAPLAEHVPRVAARTRALVADWRARGVVDVAPELVALSHRVLLGVAFTDDAIVEALLAPLDAIMAHAERAFRSFSLEALPAARARHRRALDAVDATLARAVATGALALPIDPSELRDELVNLVHGGTRETSALLTWALVLVASHPDALRAVERELDRELGDRDVTVDDLARLRHLDAVLMEALRLYPPAWVFSRTTHAATTLGAWSIPARATLLVSPYVLHRRPDTWPDPDTFLPERFLEPSAAARHAFLPFGSGGHVCLGRELAVLESKVALATILQSLRLTPVSSAPVRPHARMVLAPHGPVRMHVAPRPASA